MADCGCEQYNHVGTTGRSVVCTTWAQILPDDVAAHAAGDVISPELTFGCATRRNGGTAQLLEVAVAEVGDATHAPVKPAMTLILYRATQAVAAQNAAYVAPADPKILIGIVPIIAGDWVDIDSNNALAIVQSGLTIQTDADATAIFGVLVADGAPSWTDNTVQKLHLQLRIARD